MEKGLLCKDAHENVIRLAPPLVIEPKDIDWAIERIAAVLLSARAGAAAQPARGKPVAAAPAR